MMDGQARKTADYENYMAECFIILGYVVE